MNPPRYPKLKSGLIVMAGGTTLFCGVSILQGNEKFYKDWLMPVLQKLTSAETAHRLSVKAMKYNLVPVTRKQDFTTLKTKVFNRTFDNPLGIAAGFDKHGEAVDGLFKMGFGFVEVGSITPLPQKGNPKPRVFRLKEDRAIINRYGFNSDGHQIVHDRLKARKEHHSNNNENTGILGVNLGKNKTSDDPVADYVQGVTKFGDMADYLVINISSPNTPGLRDMQGRQQLENLVLKVVEARDNLQCDPKPAILVKIAPDLNDKDKLDIAAVIGKKGSGVDGLIVTNTTVSRPPTLSSYHSIEVGGLSGEPLRDISTNTVRDMFRLLQGKVPIVGVGGISSGEDAYDKIKAGASLVQIYTALTYEGPPIVCRINRELDDLLRKDGYSSVHDAVGKDINKNILLDK